jgi:glycerol uptake facilitator-like aquaporin
MIHRLLRQSAAEGLGTAGLALAVFGGGHLVLSLGASKAEAALVGTVAVVAILGAVLYAIGPLTGGHVNPAVSWSMFVTGEISLPELGAYVASQCAGAAGGAVIANALWTDAIFSIGDGTLSADSFAAEGVAAFALIALIHGAARGGNGNSLPVVVPAVVAGISFTAPFGLANPAIAIAKCIVGGAWSVSTMALLVVVELAVATLAAVLVRILYDGERIELEAPPVAGAERLVTFEVKLAEGADQREEAMEMALKVVERSLRPSDFVIRGKDSRLIVFVEATGEGQLAALRRRVQENVHLALLAADLADVRLIPAYDDRTAH